MSGATVFVRKSPGSAKVRCTVCGRFGYSADGPWAAACRAGHPFECGTCGKRFPDLYGWGQHKRRSGHGADR